MKKLSYLVVFLVGCGSGSIDFPSVNAQQPPAVFASETFVGTLTGCAETLTSNVHIARSGNLVTIDIPVFRCGNTISKDKTLIGMPSTYFPASIKQGFIMAKVIPDPSHVNDAPIMGVLNVGPNGVISFYPSMASVDWPLNVPSRVYSVSFSYTIH